MHLFISKQMASKIETTDAIGTVRKIETTHALIK